MHPFSRNRSVYNQPQTNQRPFSNPVTQRQSSPKVVQIPVHFVNSKPVDRSGSALKIQKAFRGYLVRKSMNRIKNVKKQVDEVKEKLSKRETVELIKKDEKERLRVSEGLMSHLIKLDSIRGFDFGVRECRKAVIRKAIALQERVDRIVFLDNLDEKVESLDTDCVNGSGNDEKLVECVEKVETLDTHCEKDGKLVECVEILDDFAKTNCAKNDRELEGCDEVLDGCGKECEDSEIETIVDVGVDSEINVSEENGTKKNESLVENCEVKNEIGDWVESESDNGNERNNELMDRMAQDNAKMMNMMKQLFDSNEKQMKMINALSHRVEMLEKAVVCDRRRKEKQKKRAASCGDE